MFREGTKVHGLYFGQAYEGTVVECRPHTVHPTRIEHIVALDRPIVVFEAVRDRVTVATHDPKEHSTIEAAR